MSEYVEHLVLRAECCGSESHKEYMYIARSFVYLVCLCFA